MKVFTTLCFALFFIFLSCEDPTDVGSGIIPDGDALQVDSIAFQDFIFNNYRDDGIPNSNASSVQLGEFNSDIFGKTMASYYTEVKYDTTFNHQEGAQLDSMILYLNVSGVQGDRDKLLNLNVYELGEPLKEFSAENRDYYYIGETVAKGDMVMQISDISYNTLDTIVNGSDTIRHIKAQLPASFAENTFAQLNNESTTVNSFYDYLKGLVFEVESNDDNETWLQITPNTASQRITGLKVHYSNGDDVFEDTQRFNISSDRYDSESVLILGAQNMNPIINTYDEAESTLINQFENPTAAGYEQGYVQAGNGTYLEMDLSNVLDDFTTSNPVINFATLTIKVDMNDHLDDTLYMPSSLFISEGFISDDDGDLTGGFYGIDGSGLPNTADKSRFDAAGSSQARRIKRDLGQYEYIFTMPKTIQSLVNSDVNLNPQFLLLPNNRVNSFNGIKFEKSDAELKIFYTKTN